MTFYNVPGAYNIAISYSSPTFTIEGVGGRALSTSNPGYVVMPSKSTGQLIRIPVTANQDFIDDSGASEILNNLFGLTTGVAAATDIPFCIYAVSNDAENTIAFMISRRFGRTITPSASNIGAPDDAVSDSFYGFWSLENITETLFNNNPCLPIGSFRMQMSASDDWTVQTLNFYNDGIDRWQTESAFTVPAGHFGAAAGKYFSDEGGTAPGFTSDSFTYTFTEDGFVTLNFVFGTNNVAGVGSGNATIQSPFPTSSATTVSGSGFYLDNSAGARTLTTPVLVEVTNDIRHQIPGIYSGGYFRNSDVDASDWFLGTVHYKT